MNQKKLYVKTALKALESESNKLVWWFPWNGIIRDREGGVIGTLSSRVIDKLMDTEKLEFKSYGSGLLDHEKYYCLKNKSNNTNF